MVPTKNSRKKRIIIIITAVVLVLIAVSFVYLLTGQYKAQDRAKEILQSADNLEIVDNLYILSPDVETTTAIIFYPGAKVETVAYLPLMQKLTSEIGVTTVIVEMPFNMAFFGVDYADEVMNLMAEFDTFYLAGHSLGSAMASSYADKNSDIVEGLIVLGGYVYGGYDKNKSITIYGSLNSELEKSMDYQENIFVIDGGNHAQFGDYGKQKGDEDALISAEQQEDEAVALIKAFINGEL